MRIEKGSFGYIRRQKYVRVLRTLGFFGLAAAILLAGLILNHGDKKNIYTVIAMVGCIPAAMSFVSMVMILLRKPMSSELYHEISEHQGKLMVMYEVFLTTRDLNMFLDAVIICGDYVTAYESEDAKSSDITFMEEYLKRTLRASGYNVSVKIFDSKKHFLERMDALVEKEENYASDRDYLVRAVLQAISL